MPSWELTRFVVLRALGAVYLVAFLVLLRQMDPLLGSDGLEPVGQFLSLLQERYGTEAYWQFPTLLWLSSSDGVMHLLAWAGLALSVAATLGATNAILQLLLWAIYLSFVHVGQTFYGFGWEIQLLETGLLAVFLCPVRSVRPFPAARAPAIVLWLFRWLIFRIMVGAVLIKLRNDPCWRDLSCLDYHFETQPNPGPLAWWFHKAPHAVHVVGLLFNHVVEGIVPWFAFGPRRWRHAAGTLLVLFQGTLIASGNLSFLNWLTIVPALACFDDTFWVRFLPEPRQLPLLERFGALPRSTLQQRTAVVYSVVVALLSMQPVTNLLSAGQAMNTSFDPLDMVNTYGAFGTVDRARYEVILEGTRDEPRQEGARWQEYELPCMPGDVRRRPCLITPYHLRLDWQMWFVGNASAQGERIGAHPWLVRLVWQLLQGNPSPEPLLARDPFPGSPPRYIRAGIWKYRFSDDHGGGRWWDRQRVGEYLPPVSLETTELREYAEDHGW